MSKIDVNERKKSHEVDEVVTNELGVRLPRQRRRHRSVVGAVSLTRQADHDRANIHKVLDKYKKTGLLPQRVAEPIVGETPDVDSFHQAMTLVVQAREQFDAMPVAVRQAFENNPSKLLAAIQDPEQKSKLIKLGVLNAPQEAPQGGATPPNAPGPNAPQNAGEGQGAAPQGQ